MRKVYDDEDDDDDDDGDDDGDERRRYVVDRVLDGEHKGRPQPFSSSHTSRLHGYP